MELKSIAIQCVKCVKAGRAKVHTVEEEYYRAIMKCPICNEDTFWEVVEEETKAINPEYMEEDHGLQEVEAVIVKSQDRFVHLHVHSEYSLLDGFGHPAEYAKRAKELGQTAIAVTDHGSIAAHQKWFKECEKEGVKPILGCELYVVDSINVQERKRNHITVWAKNNEGLVNLNKLVTISNREGFYYKPRVDWELLAKHSKGLIATSGCPASKTGQMVIRDRVGVDDVVKELKRQRGIFEEYYVEMSPWSYKEGKEYARTIYRAAEKAKIQMVLTMDAHYPTKEQERVQDIMLCIQTRSRMRDVNRMTFEQKDFYIKSEEEMEDSWRMVYPDLLWKKELVLNTHKIASSVNVTLPKAASVVFEMLTDKEEHLKEMCRAQLKARGLMKNKEYVARAKRELELITSKKFVDYFLVIQDMVVWAKKQGIFVGPARGSSCGSLVCYLIGITTVDPIPYGLLFERFIDANRSDLPDIDMDFEDGRRAEVKKYLSDKYGASRVANLSTYGTFGGRMCLQDVGKVFDVPMGIVDQVKQLVVNRSGGDSRYGMSVEDTFTGFEKAAGILRQYPALNYAKSLEGYVRSKGVHAAGVIISNDPIENFASCYFDKKSGEQVIHMDYDDIVTTGLLKIDILGLTALTIMKKCSQMIKKRKHLDIDFQAIDLEDKKVVKAFCKMKMFGIFQFDGQAVMGVCRQVQPQNFRELVAVTALGRPGALHGGGTTSYIARKDGKEKILYEHEMLKAITGETYGVPIYQEQVMQIVREMGKFSWEQTSRIRKIMSKNEGVESFNKLQDQFVDGAAKDGVSEEKAIALWKSICTFGSWAFNKSHSVAYTTISFWMMWLKVYHPLEFYCAMLQCEKDDDSKKKIIKEFVNDGGQLLPVNVNRSKELITIDQKGLRAGFMDVKGIGEGVAEKLVSKQPYSSVQDLTQRMKKSSVIDTLVKIGACEGLTMGHRSLTLNLFESMDNEDATPPPPPRVDDIIEFCPVMIVDKVHAKWKKWVTENINMEVQTKKGKDKYSLLTIAQMEKIQKRTNVLLIVRTNKGSQFNPKNRIDESMTKGTPMAVEAGKKKDDYDILDFTVDDETSFVTCRLSHDIYPTYKNMMWDTKPQDVLLIAGWCGPDFMMVFTKSVVNLTQLVDRMDKGEAVTEEERTMLKKGTV